MAEIRIERKGRGIGWLWLLLALVIVAIMAWYFLYQGRASNAPATEAAPTTGQLGPAVSAPAVAVRLVHRGGEHGEEG